MANKLIYTAVAEYYDSEEPKPAERANLRLYLISKDDPRAPAKATHVDPFGGYYKRGAHGLWYEWRSGDWWHVRADVRETRRALSLSDWEAPLRSELRNADEKQLHHGNARLPNIAVTHDGAKLKAMRLAAGLQREDIAYFLGFSAATVARLESLKKARTSSYCYVKYRDFLLARQKR